MIIEEYKSEGTTIRIDDRDIVTKEENKEIMNMLLRNILKLLNN